MEANACEKLCPDCPRRTGLARFTGGLTMWWARKTLQGSRIDRGNCEGTVPMYAGAPGGTAVNSDTNEWRRDEVWIRKCPASIPENAVRLASEQIVTVFAVNPHITVYVDRVIETMPEQQAAVEQQSQI